MAKRLGANWSWGETTCYRLIHHGVRRCHFNGVSLGSDDGLIFQGTGVRTHSGSAHDLWSVICHPTYWVGICWQNICYHAAAPGLLRFVIPFKLIFYLICNMTVFWKSWILTFWPHPLSPQGQRHRPSFENHVWYVSYFLYLCLHANFCKYIDNLLSYCEI